MSKYQYYRSTLVPVLGYTALALFLANFCVFLHKHILPEHGHEAETLCLAEGELMVHDVTSDTQDAHKRHWRYRHHRKHRLHIVPWQHLQQNDASSTPQNVEIHFSNEGKKIYVQRVERRSQDASEEAVQQEPHQIHLFRRDGKQMTLTPPNLHPNSAFKLRLENGRVIVQKENQELKDLDVELREFDGKMLDLNIELKRLEEQVKLDLERINAEQQHDDNVSLELKPSTVIIRR